MKSENLIAHRPFFNSYCMVEQISTHHPQDIEQCNGAVFCAVNHLRIFG
jgi:hypothetical protein